MNFNIEYIGLIAAILTTSGFAPQVIKTLRTKSVKGVSLSMFLILFVGMMFWLYYGIRMNSISIIFANIVSGLLVLIQIIAKLRYSKFEE